MGLLHISNIHKLHNNNNNNENNNNIYIYKTLRRKYHDTFFCFRLNLAAQISLGDAMGDGVVYVVDVTEVVMKFSSCTRCIS